MYNEELRTAPYRIWYATLDENGNEVSRDVYPKKYKTLSRAWSIALKIFNDRSKYRIRIHKRNPWKVYERVVTCDACGGDYTIIEHPDGLALDDCMLHIH